MAREPARAVGASAPVPADTYPSGGPDDPHLPDYAAFLAARERFLHRVRPPESREERRPARD